MIYALPVICLIMCLICLVKNGFNASACLVCFEFTICRFHSNDFLINTKFLKLKKKVLFLITLVKFGLIDFRDLIKMKSFVTRIETISTRFLYLRISDFLKSNWFEKDKTRILLKFGSF